MIQGRRKQQFRVHTKFWQLDRISVVGLAGGIWRKERTELTEEEKEKKNAGEERVNERRKLREKES